jgi:hypothetical protein
VTENNSPRGNFGYCYWIDKDIDTERVTNHIHCRSIGKSHHREERLAKKDSKSFPFPWSLAKSQQMWF